MALTFEQTPATFDLHSTVDCPVSARCEACQRGPDLAVTTVDTPVGVACLTRCDTCRRRRVMPAWTGPVAALRAADHCHHLGISRDLMTSTLLREGFASATDWWLPA